MPRKVKSLDDVIRKDRRDLIAKIEQQQKIIESLIREINRINERKNYSGNGETKAPRTYQLKSVGGSGCYPSLRF